jgi:ankyrin repeat protein
MEKLFIFIMIFIVISVLLFVFPQSSSLREMRNFTGKKIGKGMLRYGIVGLAIVIGIYISFESGSRNLNSESNEYESEYDPYYEGEEEYERIEKEKAEEEVLQSAGDSIEKRSIQFIDALEMHDFKTARNLLEAGIDFSFTNYDGWSALHIAAQQCNTEFIQLLLDHGMEVEPTGFNTTPLSYMLHINDEDVGYMDIVNGHTDYPFTLEAVRILLEHGSNPNAIDDLGMTPLMHAANDNNLEVMKLLIEKGAVVNEVAENGWSALMHASYSLAFESVEFLIHQGADTGIVATGNNGGVDSAGLDAKGLAEWTYTTHQTGTAEHLSEIRAVLEGY